MKRVFLALLALMSGLSLSAAEARARAGGMEDQEIGQIFAPLVDAPCASVRPHASSHPRLTLVSDHLQPIAPLFRQTGLWLAPAVVIKADRARE